MAELLSHCYTNPRPECTGGIVNANVFFCECDYLQDVIDKWMPLEEKLKNTEADRIRKLRAPEMDIGTLEEKDGQIVGDEESDRWIIYDVDMSSFWNTFHYNKSNVRLTPGSQGERSMLTDMLPMTDFPIKRREAEWGEWPYPRGKIKYQGLISPAGQLSSMMSRLLETRVKTLFEITPKNRDYGETKIIERIPNVLFH